MPDFEKIKELAAHISNDSKVSTTAMDEIQAWGSSTEIPPISDPMMDKINEDMEEKTSPDLVESSDTDLSSRKHFDPNYVDKEGKKVAVNTPTAYIVSESMIKVEGTVSAIDNKSVPPNEPIESSSSDPETSSEEEEFEAIDMFETESCSSQNFGFELVKTVGVNTSVVTSDILLVANKEHEFRVHQEVLKEHSRYFEQLLSTTGSAFYTIHIDSAIVNPEALDTALHFLYEGRLMKVHSMIHLHRTALFFQIDSVITKLQEVLENKMGIVENALAKFVFSCDLSTEFQNSKYLEDQSLKDQVSVRGEYRDLTADQLNRLCNADFIKNKRCNKKINPGTLFEQCSLKPKIIVDNNNPQSLWLIDVFKSNFYDAVFMDSTKWQNSIKMTMQLSLEFLAKNFEELVMKNDYLELNFDQMQKLIQQDVLGSRSEMIVFLAVLKWLDYKYLDREEYTEQLMSSVRFSCMSAEELMACFHPPILMGLMEKQEVKGMLNNALQYITAKSQNQERLFKHLASKPRELLLKEKPLILWELDAYDPDCYSPPSSESSDDFVVEESNRNAAAQTQSPTRYMRTMQLPKKTHVSKFLLEFEDD